MQANQSTVSNIRSGTEIPWLCRLAVYSLLSLLSRRSAWSLVTKLLHLGMCKKPERLSPIGYFPGNYATDALVSDCTNEPGYHWCSQIQVNLFQNFSEICQCMQGVPGLHPFRNFQELLKQNSFKSFWMSQNKVLERAKNICVLLSTCLKPQKWFEMGRHTLPEAETWSKFIRIAQVSVLNTSRTQQPA